MTLFKLLNEHVKLEHNIKILSNLLFLILFYFNLTISKYIVQGLFQKNNMSYFETKIYSTRIISKE